MRSVMASLAAALVLVPATFAQNIVLPDGKAKRLIENTCTECHGLEHVVNATFTPEEWKSTVKDMVKRGATLSSDEIETVLEYLTVYFSQEKVNVNTATAVELQSSLELTTEEAEAILAHRKANGKIKDIEALKKIQGLNGKKVDAKKDVLTF